MAINFPNTPTTGDSYTDGTMTWTYDGSKWVSAIANVPQSKVTNLSTDLAAKAPLASPTFTGTVAVSGTLKVQPIIEKIYITGTASSGTYNFYTQTNGVLQYITANATSHTSVNFFAADGVALNSVMAIGESLTTTFLMTNGTTAYYVPIWRVGFNNLPMKWLGGTAPSAGNASSVDSYTITIVKTADDTFLGFGSVSKFA